MKNKNGFTLIELLAVIVILAVIALIAVPKIIKILNKSRISAAKDSTMGIVEAAESYVASFMLQNQGAIPSEDFEFSCNMEGCILSNELTNYNTENLNTLEFKGKKPTGGAITISENGNKVTVYGLLINNFVCNYIDGMASCIDIGNIGPTKENPPTQQHVGVKAIVYLDPTDLTHECTSKNINSDTGTKTGCMKWYAYAEDDNTYTMILDHNTTAVTSWNSQNNNKDTSEIYKKLNDDTLGWNNNLNPRLITADEIASITNYDDWQSDKAISSNWFYFQDLGLDTMVSQNCVSLGCKYAWLYDRTNSNCKSYGCANNATGTTDLGGYWTSTAIFGLNTHVWCVVYDGHLGNSDAWSSNSAGIRPVITIPKSLISN